MQPVQGGGIPPQHAALELKITFKEGGAYDFHGRYERVKERLQQQVEVARESGRVVGDGSEVGRGTGGGALSGVDVGNVHLEDLPAYEEEAPPPSRGGGPAVEGVGSAVAAAAASDVSEGAARIVPAAAPRAAVGGGSASFDPPAEPPPGYEEVQRLTVQDELERRLGGGQ